jgi:hypothetical protein
MSLQRAEERSRFDATGDRPEREILRLAGTKHPTRSEIGEPEESIPAGFRAKEFFRGVRSV